MKNIGIVRRTPEDNHHVYLVKLDVGCIPDGDDRKVFSVIDSKFCTLGTARLKETKHGLGVFELMIPGRLNAAAIYSMTEKGMQLWGRSNAQCNDIFCIEVGIMCHDADPESYGYREYHDDYKMKRPQYSTQRSSRTVFQHA